jgi:hypothetical protein
VLTRFSADGAGPDPHPIAKKRSEKLVSSIYYGVARLKDDIKAFSEKELEAVYRNAHKFVPSLSLVEMATSGKFEP